MVLAPVAGVKHAKLRDRTRNAPHPLAIAIYGVSPPKLAEYGVGGVIQHQPVCAVGYEVSFKSGTGVIAVYSVLGIVKNATPDDIAKGGGRRACHCSILQRTL